MMQKMHFQNTKAKKLDIHQTHQRSPLISVLMPIFKAAATIGDAIDSILQQSFADFELIIVDDGADSETQEILMGYTDRRINILQQEHSGIVAALNRGISVARGQFIARMDADDISRPQRLEKQLQLLQSEPSLTAVGCGVEIFPKNKVTDGMLRYINWLNSVNTSAEIRANMFIEMPILHPTLMLRRQRLQNIGGYRNGDFPEDYDLLLRLFYSGGKFAKVSNRFYCWREHEMKLSRISAVYRQEAFRELKLTCVEKFLLQKNHIFLFWGVGRDGKIHARSLARRGWKPQAFIDISPKKIGRNYLGCPIIGPGQIPKYPPLILCCVGTKGAREEIRKFLLQRNLIEGEHFWFLA